MATVVLWALTAGVVIAAFAAYISYIHPAIVHDLSRVINGNEDSAATERLRLCSRLLLQGGWAAVSAWSGLVLGAAACTVRFVLVSRRATMSRIRTGLAEISEQLRRARLSE